MTLETIPPAFSETTYPIYGREIWAEILGVLDSTDLIALNMHRDGQTPFDWIRTLAEAAAKHLDSEECDRDHCPEDCSINCHLSPTGAPNAQA